ncbi:hypothetical protein BU24DRAFT_141274 [Aaosphaeria arxii CBS 175.79]|uniref:Uncharacterized protein n=1 Tax=Aaosphaeria arxii CBS 175.79 TaxID=1450172 RepID=A0A6A5XW83_9PLEO|nr:uncharacterized protein BU24DRAFT_141274 [Aaosphaeria arxii CBS 175.79]KAF2016971.1 hypothetical protein BU24DRAFT_141274 [Aaosphaeria arxii CBS 175.79]
MRVWVCVCGCCGREVGGEWVGWRKNLFACEIPENLEGCLVARRGKCLGCSICTEMSAAHFDRGFLVVADISCRYRNPKIQASGTDRPEMYGVHTHGSRVSVSAVRKRRHKGDHVAFQEIICNRSSRRRRQTTSLFSVVKLELHLTYVDTYSRT